MSEPQKEASAFEERFLNRWDTDPAFRATWSMVGGGAALIFLILCVVLALNTSGSLLRAIAGNPTATLPPDSGQRADVGIATFPVGTLTPAAPGVDNRQPTLVAASNAPPPSPTVAPTPPGTPATTPTVTGTPDPNQTPTATPIFGNPTATPTGQPQYLAPQQQPTPWTPGIQATITFYSDATQANKVMIYSLTFTDACNLGPNSATLKADGGASLKFIVPACVKGGTLDVVGTFTIQGQLPQQYHFIAKGP